MPTRLLRPEILTSESIDKLSFGAEVFYRRLMSVVDDYGRYDGRPTMLRSHLYPLRIDSVSDKDVSGWLNECRLAGVISLYIVESKQYVEVLKFYQRTRSPSKWPANDSQATAVCGQMSADVRKCPRYSESESEAYSETYAVKTNVVPAKPSRPTSKVLTLDEIKALPAYEGIDVQREHDRMQAWCAANGKLPSPRRFINWLNRVEKPMTNQPQLPAFKPAGDIQERYMARIKAQQEATTV